MYKSGGASEMILRGATAFSCLSWAWFSSPLLALHYESCAARIPAAYAA